MAKRSLVVVESPTKVKTIQKYLDSKFIVKASMGHVRDLPKSQLGVDPKRNFKPKYVVAPAKRKVLDDLALCRDPYNCPHGRPVSWTLPRRELEENFRRIIK